LCLLGLGLNGHLGLNEPGRALKPWPHVATLTGATRRHAMLKTAGGAIRYGMTLGLANLLASRRIVLLVSGRHKRAPLRQLLRGAVTTHCPASLLWLHPRWLLICDRAAGVANTNLGEKWI